MYNRQKVKNLVAEFCTQNKGETQESVANKMGISTNTLFGSNPTAENLEKIANFLGITISDLFTNDSKVERHLKVSAPVPHYGKQSNEELYKELYEQQKLITKLLMEKNKKE